MDDGVGLSSRTLRGRESVGDQGGVPHADAVLCWIGEPLQFASRLIERVSGRSRRVCGASSAR